MLHLASGGAAVLCSARASCRCCSALGIRCHHPQCRNIDISPTPERQNQANVQQMSFANRLLLCPCLLPALPSSCCVSATLPCSPNVSLFSLLSEAARGVVCAHMCARSCRVWERAAWYLNAVHPIGIGSQHALCPSLCWGYLIVHLIR